MSVDARIREGLTMIEKELPEVDTLEAYENLERDIRRDHRRRQAVIGAAAAAVVLAAAGAVILNHDDKKVEPAHTILPNRVTVTDPNGRISYVAADGTRHTIPAKQVDRFAISPDGQQSAYISFTNAKDGSGRRLWIANADGTNPEQVPMPCKGCEPAFGVTWSHDGSRIAYSVFTPGTKPTKLAIRDLTTGDEQVFTMPPGDDARGLTFSPNDKLLAMNLATEGGEGVATMDPARGVISLTPLGGLYNQVQAPSWSEDGRTIYFTATSDGDNLNDTKGRNDLYAVKVDDSSTRQITQASKGERFFGSIPYKSYFLTSRVKGEGQWTVGWLSADGKTFTPMTGPNGQPVLGNGAQLQP